MTDEFEIIHIDHDESQAIIDWAVETAAAIIMTHELLDNEYETAEEKAQDLDDCIKMMHENIPEILVRPAESLANNLMQEVIEEEEAVEQFRNQLDEL